VRVAVARSGPFALRAADRAELFARLEAAVQRARRDGEALAALTVDIDPATDPSAVAFASRRAGEPWFCLEQPDRDGVARGGLGCVRSFDAAGPERFREMAASWRALAASAICEPQDGLAAVGGFAFAPYGGTVPHWGGFPPASLHVPEVALVRRGGSVRMTVAALASRDDTAEGLLARIDQRLDGLRDVALPLLDPSPTGRFRVVGSMPPEHYEEAVARAVERIRGGQLEKVVLAREVQVHAPASHDPAALFGVLREAFPSCFVFCVGRDESAFVAASPELLVRREGLRASTLALAGSTRRSADRAVENSDLACLRKRGPVGRALRLPQVIIEYGDLHRTSYAIF
jgi:isochorismate synthase EntC